MYFLRIHRKTGSAFGGVRVEVGAFLCYTVANEKVMQFFTTDHVYDRETGKNIIIGTRFSNLLWEDLSYDFTKDIIYVTNK